MSLAPALKEKGPQEPNEEQLWKLYEMSLRDRDFQVTLNWDRTKHYFLFNFAALSVAGSSLVSMPVVQQAVLVLVALNSLFAAFSIYKGHTYYRETRKRLKTIERILGLITDDDSPLAIKSTRGMLRETTGQKKRLVEHVTIVNLAIALQLFIAGVAILVLSR